MAQRLTGGTGHRRKNNRNYGYLRLI